MNVRHQHVTLEHKRGLAEHGELLIVTSLPMLTGKNYSGLPFATSTPDIHEKWDMLPLSPWSIVSHVPHTLSTRHPNSMFLSTAASLVLGLY